MLLKIRDRFTLHVLIGATLLLAGCAQGEYRMPYESGTVVDVLNDHVSHSTPHAYMYDIQAQNVASPVIVAAAPGWIRFIEDSNEEPTSVNNYVWIEHPYPFCPVDPSRANWPGKPANYNSTCIPCDREFCNEWTTYAHMTKNSVTGDAGLHEGQWVEAGTFLGYEDQVGDATVEHLHWHVAVIPPDTQPSFNGYYLDYVEATGIQPELIPIVCHAGGQSVIWRFGIYTAAGCPERAQGPARSLVLPQTQHGSPLARALQNIASISDECVWIAMNEPRLLLETRQVMNRMDTDFQDLLHLGRARISTAELKTVLRLLGEFERRGSAEVARVLAPIRKQLESPGGRQILGIAVDGRFEGID